VFGFLHPPQHRSSQETTTLAPFRSKDTAFQIASHSSLSPPCRSMCELKTERGIRRQIPFHIPRLFFPTRVRVLPILFLAADGCLRSRAVAVNDGCSVVLGGISGRNIEI